MTTAVYPGSFDPVTLGHMNIISRAAGLFDRVVVCVMVNSDKRYMFTPEERLELVRLSVAPLGNVTALGYEGLLSDFMAEQNARVIVKGLRTTDDFNIELQMDRINKLLDGRLETVFLAADPALHHVSSTAAREMIRHGRGEENYLPPQILNIIKNKQSFGRK